MGQTSESFINLKSRIVYFFYEESIREGLGAHCNAENYSQARPVNWSGQIMSGFCGQTGRDILQGDDAFQVSARSSSTMRKKSTLSFSTLVDVRFFSLNFKTV